MKLQAHPHSCFIDPSGKYGLISDLGLDKIYVAWNAVFAVCSWMVDAAASIGCFMSVMYVAVFATKTVKR